MKKTAIATAALLTVTLFSTVAPAVHAADVTLPSSGDVNFVANPTTGAGEIKLTKAPSVDFGDQEISGSDAKYDAATITDSIVVDDNRGSNEGWKLTVANTQFTGSKELAGAKLTLTPGTVSNNNGASYNATQPTADMVLDGSSQSVAVVDAAKDMGMGTNTLPVTKATLDVPGASTKLKEKYTSVITWTLNDAPL
ncbi:WxL domain-containing protein [Dellaglioa sp. P0083]|uniref:WxL domain-containing protein n=1 Tax=Dellaglioa kimchii TaxID=3344667 RepID=UPI0038D360D8